MNQYTKRALLSALLLVVCAALLGSCIHPLPGDFHTTVPNTTPPAPEESGQTTPEESTPEVTTPQETTPQETTKGPETETTPEELSQELMQPGRDPVVTGLTVLALLLTAGILGVLVWVLVSFRGAL